MSTYLDANLPIYVVENNPVFGPRATARLHTLQAQGEHFVVSDLTRMECKVGPLMRNDAPLLLAFERFFTASFVQIVPLTANVLDRAAVIRATYRFKALDSIHLAAAVEHGCTRFLTNDTRLSRFTGIVVDVL